MSKAQDIIRISVGVKFFEGFEFFHSVKIIHKWYAVWANAMTTNIRIYYLM